MYGTISFIRDPRNMDVSIRRLREKIEDDPGSDHHRD